MEKSWLKFKIKSVLFCLKLLKKLGFHLGQFFIALGKILEVLALFILRKTILPFLPLYLRLKKSIKKQLANFHYQGGFLSFFAQRKLWLFCLIFVLVFVFSENNISLHEDFFAEAVTSNDKKGEVLADFRMAADEEIVFKPVCFFEYDFIPTRIEVEKYVVQRGDTVSSIAEKFGISVNTILWENKLSPYSVIRPNQVLKILPASGVTHKVKRGDTVDKIANLYRADKENIARFNNLTDMGVVAGQIIIIPEGRMPPPPPTPTIFRKIGQEKIWVSQFDGKERTGVGCRDFYPGQCTWYVAQKYCIPWSGHAKSWLSNAPKYGFSIGKTPSVGAIISLRETRYGHVGIVEEIKENTLVFSEMNHLGSWKVNKREIDKNDRRINGYIYLQVLKN